ncbi:uncharacterized protein [Solanum lycopersicum]|uniref:uncharacterized protein n=1 Tax=Solanum lycopersicum TaxID=4081 RepID=UPI0037487F6D
MDYSHREENKIKGSTELYSQSILIKLEDTKDASPELEKGVKVTVDALKEINLGTEAVFPLERQIPSLRFAIQEGLIEKDNAHLRLEDLEALDDKSLEAQQSLECYQARLSRAFNKKVRLRSFKVGDQVHAVRRPIIISHKSKGKFTSKWDGTYVIQEVYSSGAYKLVNADGLRIGPINGKFLKKYYP